MKKEYIKPDISIIELKDNILWGGASQENPGIDPLQAIKFYDEDQKYENPFQYRKYKPYSDYEEYTKHKSWQLWD